MVLTTGRIKIPIVKQLWSIKWLEYEQINYSTSRKSCWKQRFFAPVINMNFYHFLGGLKSHDPSLPKNIEIVVMLDVSQNTSKCRTMCSWRILHRVVWKISSRVDKARTLVNRTAGQQCNFLRPIWLKSAQKRPAIKNSLLCRVPVTNCVPMQISIAVIPDAIIQQSLTCRV